MGKGILVRRRAEHDKRLKQVKCLNEAFDNLVKMAEVKDGSSKFIFCDTIGQTGLYEVKEILTCVLLDVGNALGPFAMERLRRAFPRLFVP